MIYVSGIANGVSSLYFDVDAKCSVRLYDTYARRNMVVDCQDLRNMNAPYGYARSAMDMDKSRCIVAYDSKTVQILEHISKVSTREKEILSDCDHVAIGMDTVKHISVENRSKLSIMTTQGIYLGGRKGSVPQLIYEFAGVEKPYNMYEFIAMLCKQTRLNVMRYESVSIYCRLDEVSTIHFSHDKRAELFYSKMLLDVVK